MIKLNKYISVVFILLFLFACKKGDPSKPGTDFDTFYKCKVGVNSKVCEDEKPWWLLALAQPSTSAVNQTPQTYTQDSTITISAGQSVSYNPPSHVEGSKYTVSPTLPAGLVLDANTGVISGTPTTAITSTKYIVTQTKPDSTTATIAFTIVVNASAPTTYTVGGSITGLTAAGLVLQNNTADDLTVAANATTFSFATKVTGAYAVTVKTQPTGLACTVSSGSGTATANVSNVAVACVANTYTIGGSITGLTAAGLVLQNNAGDDLTVSANATTFSFATKVTGAYAVTVKTQPTGLTCTVSSGSGTASANVTNIAVTCSNAGGTTTYTIGGTVTGLSGTLVLQNNTTDDKSITTDGNFTFATSISSGATYTVTIKTQPADQTCTITTGTGTASANVTNIAVTCSFNAPSVLTYTGSPYTFTRTVAITTITPTVTGKVTTCRSVPALPAGLNINDTTCAISGSPTTTQTSTKYTITAKNSTGEITADIYIAVNAAWIQEAYLKAQNSNASDYFGYSVSLSGETVAVGSYGEASNQTTITNGTTASTDNSKSASGAVYIFKRDSSNNWAQEAYIKASNPDASDNFGHSVSIDGDTIVVGARKERSNQTTITNGTTAASSDNSFLNVGAAYVYKRTGTTWAQEAYIKASNAGANDNFGYSVSISGNTIAVGAYGESSNQATITNGTTAGSADNSKSNSGAVYIYKRDVSNNWAQEAYIKAPNPDGGDYFGYSVSISSDTIVSGAYREASSQTSITNGTTASTSNSYTDAGAAYVFKRTGTTWAQEAYIKPSNMKNMDRFGYSVSVSGDTIVAGAVQEDSNQTTITNGTTASSDASLNDAGAAYVFKRTGTTWAQEAYIKPSNTKSFANFGESVSISSDTLAVGVQAESSNQTTITNGTNASADNSANYSGATYVFKRTGTTWAQEAYIKASNANGSDYFGISASIDGSTLAVGAYGESSNQTTITNGTTASADNSASSAGAVYVFRKQ